MRKISKSPYFWPIINFVASLWYGPKLERIVEPLGDTYFLKVVNFIFDPIWHFWVLLLIITILAIWFSKEKLEKVNPLFIVLALSVSIAAFILLGTYALDRLTGSSTHMGTDAPENTATLEAPVKNVLFEDNFCTANNPNWRLVPYTDSFAQWSGEIREEECRLIVETRLLSSDIGWFRLYQDASGILPGNLKFADFDWSVYSRVLDTTNIQDTWLSFHFRISAEETYANYWIWVNNSQEYCFAARTPSSGGGCQQILVDGVPRTWIKDSTINPLMEGNTVRIQVYGSEIRVFFNGDMEAKGSPLRSNLLSTSGYFSFGIRSGPKDVVRVEYKDFLILEENR